MAGQMRAAWAILKKDLAVWLRNPGTIFATLLTTLGILFILVIWAAAALTYPVAVVNLDGAAPAAQVMEQTALGFQGFRAQLMSSGQANLAFANLDVAAVLTIPPGFSADLAAGRLPSLSWQVRNFNKDAANDLSRDVGTVVDRFLATGTAGPDPVHVTVDEGDVHPRDADLVGFLIVSLLGLTILQAGTVNAGLAAAREWETGAVKELLLSPARTFALIVGKVVAGVVPAVFLASALVGVALVTGLLPSLTLVGVGLSLLAMTLLALSGAGLGMALAARLRSPDRLGPISSLLPISFFFLSGGIAAMAYLPTWMQAVAYVIPNTYAVHALRDALLYHSSTGVGRDLLALALLAVMALIVGVPAMRRSLEH